MPKDSRPTASYTALLCLLALSSSAEAQDEPGQASGAATIGFGDQGTDARGNADASGNAGASGDANAAGGANAAGSANAAGDTNAATGTNATGNAGSDASAAGAIGAEAAAPEAAGMPAETEDEGDSELRTRSLQLHMTRSGSTGLFRLAHAGTGSVGSFRFALLSGFMNQTGFLCPQCVSADGGNANVKDKVSRVTGEVQLSASVLDFLELYMGIHSHATSNNRGTPELLQVLGDTDIGAKGFMPYEEDQIFTAGGALDLILLNGTGQVGIDNANFQISGLASLDLTNRKNADDRIPLRFESNLSYLFDNSGGLVKDTERARRQPITRIERYGLDINRVDTFQIGLGVEGVFDVVHPFLEWTVDVPSNRQGYTCLRSRSYVGDSCLNDNPTFSAVPSRLTLGGRVLPPFMEGLAGTVAVDIGTGATKTFWEEVAPESPYMLYFGVSYAVDPTPKVVRVPAPVPAMPVETEPDQFAVQGQVVDGESGAGIANAIVRYQGRKLTGMVTDEAGAFTTVELDPGNYTFNVTAEGYEPGTCSAMVSPPKGATAEPAPPAGAQPGADSTNPPPAAGGLVPPVEAEPEAAPSGAINKVRCELKVMPRIGNVNVDLVDAVTNAPVGTAKVRVTDKKGRQLTLSPDELGRFRVERVPEGPVKFEIIAKDHLRAVREAEAVPFKDIKLEFQLNPEPEKPNVTLQGKTIRLKQGIDFEDDSATISPASIPIVEELAALLRSNKDLTLVEIQGHLHGASSATQALSLSSERASAVREMLVNLGVNRARLTARGYGDTEKAHKNDNIVVHVEQSR